MKNVSIYGKKWLDLVFEGKNKEYGAYQLRQETEKTSALAFIFGISFLVGFVFLLSSFTEKTLPISKPDLDEPVVVVKLDNPPKTKIDEPLTKPSKTTEPVKKIETPTGQMVVSRTDQAVIDVPNNEELPKTPPNPNGTPGGTAPDTGDNSGGNGEPAKLPVIPSGPLTAKELDRQPNFPGGIKKFYEYVGDNFDKDNIEEGQTVKINVSFVVEKNGTLSDIKVIEKANSTITKEAIRILKSLKTKWSPGYKDGEAVRAYFTLPITVVI